MTRTASAHELHVRDAMHPGILTCPPEASLRTVAQMMAERRVHCIAVFGDAVKGERDGRLWAIVSDLDLVGAATSDLDERTAGAVAASPVVTVAPEETVERAAQLMREYATSHLIVVDPLSGQPVGVISTLDIAAALGGTTAH
jgi:CBS domain-containing protein